MIDYGQCDSQIKQLHIHPLILASGIAHYCLQSAALKEALDDLEWPGSSIEIAVSPVPPMVTFRGEGHGDLQVCGGDTLSINNIKPSYASYLKKRVSSIEFDMPLPVMLFKL